MSAVETVEVPVDRIRYLGVLATLALREGTSVNTHLTRVAVDGTSLPEEDARARRSALNACDLTKTLRDEIARLVPEEE